MSEQNKDVSFMNLLQLFNDQNTKLPNAHQRQDPELGLSLGGPYNRPTSRSLSRSDMAFLIRRFTLNGKPYTVRYRQVTDESSSGWASRPVSLPPDVEAEMNKPKETKAINRIKAMKRSLLKKRSMERPMQLDKDGEEEEGWHSVKIRKIEGKFGNPDAESAMKNTAYGRAIEKLKSTRAVENQNGIRNANTYYSEANPVVLESGKSTYYSYGNTYEHRNTLTPCTCHARAVTASKIRNPNKMPMMPCDFDRLHFPHVLESSEVALGASAYDRKASQKVFEIGKSTYHGERDILTRCTCPERNVAAYTGKNPDKMPMMRGSENNNPPKKTCLMSQMPSVTAVGPTGKKLEGFLYKFSTGQVTMVCRCHSHCFSPIDFVRHAGWADVANPMQHIKVQAPVGI